MGNKNIGLSNEEGWAFSGSPARPPLARSLRLHLFCDPGIFQIKYSKNEVKDDT